MPRTYESKYKIEDYLGRRFGSRVVVGEGKRISGQFGVVVRCDCGDVKTVELKTLLGGRARRCIDCVNSDQARKNNRAWKGGEYISLTQFNHWKKTAKRRGIEWRVDIDYLESLLVDQGFRCALSGVELTLGSGNKNGSVVKGNISIDRIDSRIGYIKGNVQFTTKAVNIGKQSMPESEFVEMCRAVADRSRK